MPHNKTIPIRDPDISKTARLIPNLIGEGVIIKWKKSPSRYGNATTFSFTEESFPTE
jgi:hypothetical protein